VRVLQEEPQDKEVPARLCRKVAFLRQNLKIVFRKINDLCASTFLFSVMCDRVRTSIQWRSY
jgi:hypothetical protein